jgi:hypothetical protein
LLGDVGHRPAPSGNAEVIQALQRFARGRETGFEPISLQLNDHTDRGVGGRQYGSSEDIETLQGKSNASASRFGAVSALAILF